MKEGRMYKEYREYVKTRFTTKKGLADFFVVTAIWYMIIVQVLDPWSTAILSFWSSMISWQLFAQYITYLSLGLVFTAIGLALRWVLEQVWSFIFDGKIPDGRVHK